MNWHQVLIELKSQLKSDPEMSRKILGFIEARIQEDSNIRRKFAESNSLKAIAQELQPGESIALRIADEHLDYNMVRVEYRYFSGIVPNSREYKDEQVLPLDDFHISKAKLMDIIRWARSKRLTPKLP